METQREKAEAAQAADLTQPGSLFYRAFVSTGCMVDCDLEVDGAKDRATIKPHREITDDPKLFADLHARIYPPSSFQGAPVTEDEDEKKWIFEIDDEGHIVDDEDYDDEPVDEEGCECDEGMCTCAKEPDPTSVCECEGECVCDAEWELEIPEDERDLIERASGAVSLEDVRDWGFAKRLAFSQGFKEDYFVKTGVSKRGRTYLEAAPARRASCCEATAQSQTCYGRST